MNQFFEDIRKYFNINETENSLALTLINSNIDGEVMKLIKQ